MGSHTFLLVLIILKAIFALLTFHVYTKHCAIHLLIDAVEVFVVLVAIIAAEATVVSDCFAVGECA